MYDGSLYKYTGTKTEYSQIVNDYSSNSESSTKYTFNVNENISITTSSDTIIITSDLTSLSLGSATIAGTLVNFGSLSLAYGFTNSGTIVNYGTFTTAGASTNTGTIINQAGATFSIHASATLDNPSSGTITNYGTFSGNVTGDGTRTDNITPVSTSTYYWTGNAGDRLWTTSGNWAPNSDGTGAVTAGTYPSSASDIAYFPGTEETNVTVDEDIEVGTVYLHSEGDSQIWLSKDYTASSITVTCDTVHIKYTQLETRGVTEIIGISLSCDTFETDGKKYSSDEPTYQFKFSDSAVLEIKKYCIDYSDYDFMGLAFSGNGTLYLPFSGDMVDTLDYEYGSDDSQAFDFSGITLDRYAGEPSCYSVDFDASSAELTLTRYGTEGNYVYYKYEVTSFTGTAGAGTETNEADLSGSFYYYDPIDDEYIPIDLTNSTGKFRLDTSATTQNFQIYTGSDISDGDTFKITIFTPDTRFELGTVTYTYQDEVVVEDFNTYYWTGADTTDATSWIKSANWAYKDKDRDAYISVAEYDGGSYDGHYPGYENGDTAVFQGTSATDIKSLSLMGEDYNLTILSNSSGRMALSNCSTNADSAHITIGGTETLVLNACKFGSVTVDEDTEIRLIHSSGQSVSLEVDSFEVKAGANVWGNTGAVLKVNGDFTLTGSVSDNASGKLRTLSVGGNTVINSDGAISLSSSTQTYTGTVSNAGEIALAESSATFSGGYSGTGSLSVSTGSLTFNGTASNTVENLTVTGAASITNNASTAVNLGTVSCGTADVTFTGDFTETGSFTASPASTKFKNGNVNFENGTFDANSGTVYFYNTTTDGTEYSLTSGSSPMTFATLSFGGNTKLDLKNVLSCTTFKITDADKVWDDDFTVSVTASSAHTLSVTGTGNALELSRGSGTGITNEKTGTLSVGENVTLTVSNMAYLHSGTVIQNAGTMNLKNASNVTTTGVSNPKITNSGIFTVDNAGIIAVAEIENTGTISTGSATISVQKIESTGTISLGAGSLSVTGSESSSISEISLGSTSESGGMVSNTGSGSLKIENLSAGEYDETHNIDNKVKYALISNSSSGTTSVESAIFYADTVNITNSSSTQNSLSFNYFSAEELGGSTVNFSGRVDFVDSADDTQAKLVLSGTDADSLLGIASPSTGVIYLPRAMAYGNYLSVSQKVTVGGTKPSSYWNGSPQPENSYTTYNSECTETGGVTAIYGWRFTTEYYWSGKTSTAWNLKGNWIVYSLVSTGYGRNKTYSYQAKTATKVPDSAAIVYINSTYPTGTQGSGSTQTVTHFPELSASVKVAEAHVGEEANLDFSANAFESTGEFSNDGKVYLNGGDFTVGGEFENTGTIYSLGTETVTLSSDEAKITENGTWSFSGGTVAAIEHLSYSDGGDSYSFKNLEITGDAQVGSASNGSVSAENLSLHSSSALTLTAGNSATTLSAKNAVGLENDITLDVNGSTFTIDFSIARPDSQTTDASIEFSDSSSSGGTLSFTGTSITAKDFTIDDGVQFSVDGDSDTSITLSGNWLDSNSSSGFTAASSTVHFSDSATITGNTAFNNLSATGLGGKTLTFDGNFTISGDLTLTGSSLSSFLTIQTAETATTSTSPAIINLPSAQLSGKYLVVSGVTIGEKPSEWDEKSIPDISYTAYCSIPKVEDDGSYSIPYGWNLLMDFIWTGATDIDWDKAANWNFYEEGAETETATATMIPNYMSSVTVPAGTANKPHLSSKVEISKIEIKGGTDSGELWLNGKDFTVNDSFSNEGTVHLLGRYGTSDTDPQPETISLPSSSGATTEKGTWAYFSGGDGSGILQPIENLTFKTVVAEGNGFFKSFTAESFELHADFSSSEITIQPLIATEDTNTSVEVDAPVTLLASATIDLNETPLVLKSTVADSGNSEALTIQNEASDEHSVEFDGKVSANLVFSGEVTLAGGFTQDETSTLTISSGTLSVAETLFTAGNLVVASGGSFVQTGVNTAEQSVSSINNEGFCEWDAGVEGGTLVLNGNISGSRAGETVFNKKNVSAGNDAELSGVFYDLTIPSGVTVTNGSEITIRRNLTVDGNYVHNSKTLRFGEITITVNGTDKIFTSEDENGGSYSGANESVNLGTVEITQNNRAKHFTIPVEIDSLLLNYTNADSTVSVGEVVFEKFCTISSIQNAAGTIFDIKILSGANLPNGAAFNTSGNLVLGGEFTNGADFSVSANTILDSDVVFTANSLNLTFGGTVSGEKNLTITGNSVFNDTVSCEDFKITGDTIFYADVSSKSIAFTGSTTIGANASSAPTKIDSTLTQDYTGTVTLKKSAVFTAKSSGGTGDVYSKIQFTSILGDNGADGEIFGSTVECIAGDYVLSGKLTAHASEKIVFSEGINGTLSAGNGFDFADSDVYFDFGSSTLSLSSLFEAKNLYFFDGTFAPAASSHVVSENFVAFGSNYSADDARYAGTDTRFAYFGFDSIPYIPLDSSSLPKRSAHISATSGAKITVTKNFYLNGLDLAHISLTLPDSSSSHPVFNPSADVTETQWGVPYAAVFNSTVSQCSAVASSGSAFVAASVHQGNADGSGNSGFQFAVPQISESYSISDSVLCLSFDMDLENSNGEVSSTVALTSSLTEGGIFYNANGTGDMLAFDGIFYTVRNEDDTCSVPLSESDFKNADILAGTKLYLKVASAEGNWNTDATPTSAGTEDSTDRTGTHREHTIDLSLFEGLFSAADGKTMARNYGVGLWKETGETEYSSAKINEPLDKARPVLVDVFTGQELYSKNTGNADSQKFYDSHNFIEFRYSEPVNIGDLESGSESANQNIQADSDFTAETQHGGAILNSDSGLSITGFASIATGELTSGYKNGTEHSIDTAKPHALYRKFSRSAGASEQIQKNRVRIAVAGFVDEANPVQYVGSMFHNWIGYIDSSSTPAGLVTVAENAFITDCAVDADGNALKNPLDETNENREITVNSVSPSIDSASAPLASTSLYGEWDSLPPVFATYVTNIDGSEENLTWTNGDGTDRQYEMVGTVDSNTNAYIDKIEMHLFDNKQNYADSDPYKWVAGKGWVDSSNTVMSGYSAPETAGGSRDFSSNPSKTYGGIRRSSLAGASSAFSYVYSLDGHESSERDFDTAEISQNVKSSLFRTEEQSETFTENDGVYLGISINKMDSTLPIKTVFTITYSPDDSFITDLAGNRLIQTDSGSDKKILHTIDITSPSFTMTISPVGENKMYAVFTKPLAFKGTYLHELSDSDLSAVLEKIKSNIEFVYSEDDNVDTSAMPSGDSAISVTDVELLTKTTDYSALLFTFDRAISLDDVEKIWIRINTQGEITDTVFGNVISSYIQDKNGNSLPAHTCHAISDFAVNAVNMLYAYADDTDESDWNEQGVYGEGLAPLSSDYAVHDFSADGRNYSRLRAGRDIVFQYELVGGVNSEGKFAVENGESLELVFDNKAHIRKEWKSDKFNLLTGGDWRIWIDKSLDSLASEYNTSVLSKNLPAGAPEYTDVEDSDILKNMVWKDDAFKLSAGSEYQFFFKVLDSDGKIIEINHDGDATTEKIPLYAFRMPYERIQSGDFTFIDLWSFTVSDITKQRGGVTILNNVINAGLGEKTAIEVQMKDEGNLNIYIMTLDGNIIKRLSKGTVSRGTHYFYWDGKNNAGNPVARGLYFVRVTGSGIDETRKVMVVK